MRSDNKPLSKTMFNLIGLIYGLLVNLDISETAKTKLIYIFENESDVIQCKKTLKY